MFGVHLSGWTDFTPFWLQKWLFSYINRQNLFIYCPVKAMLGNVELSVVKHSCKKGFLRAKVNTLPPTAHRNFEPENGSFNRDFEVFSIPTSKVPNFNILPGALFGKNYNFHLIETS